MKQKNYWRLGSCPLTSQSILTSWTSCWHHLVKNDVMDQSVASWYCLWCHQLFLASSTVGWSHGSVCDVTHHFLNVFDVIHWRMTSPTSLWRHGQVCDITNQFLKSYSEGWRPESVLGVTNQFLMLFTEGWLHGSVCDVMNLSLITSFINFDVIFKYVIDWSVTTLIGTVYDVKNWSLTSWTDQWHHSSIRHVINQPIMT